jgi:hypothetical protein
MLIPKPFDIDAIIRKVKKGKLITQAQIREKLAKDFNVNVTCPITTGIFIRIIAEVAEEDLKKGEQEVAPYWRVISSDGSLNPKFPGGIRKQAYRLREEGFTIIEKGKILKVKEFEKYLVSL